VEQIAHSGVPDIIVDTGEALAPGHFGADSPLRPEIDAMLEAGARYLSNLQSQDVASKRNGTSNGHNEPPATESPRTRQS